MSNTLQINLSEWNTNGVNRLVLFDKVVHFAQGICINSFHFMGIAAPPRFESNSSRKRISNSTSFFSKLNGIQKFFPIWHTFLVLNLHIGRKQRKKLIQKLRRQTLLIYIDIEIKNQLKCLFLCCCILFNS